MKRKKKNEAVEPVSVPETLEELPVVPTDAPAPVESADTSSTEHDFAVARVLDEGWPPDARGLKAFLLGVIDFDQDPDEARAELEADGVDVAGFLKTAKAFEELMAEARAEVDDLVAEFDAEDVASQACSVLELEADGVDVQRFLVALAIEQKKHPEQADEDERARTWRKKDDEVQRKHAEALHVEAEAALDQEIGIDANGEPFVVGDRAGAPLAHESAHGTPDRTAYLADDDNEWHWTCWCGAANIGTDHPCARCGRSRLREEQAAEVEDATDDLDTLRELAGVFASTSSATELAATLWGKDLEPMISLLCSLVEGIEAGRITIRRADGTEDMFKRTSKDMSWRESVEQRLQALRNDVDGHQRSGRGAMAFIESLERRAAHLEQTTENAMKISLHMREDRLSRIAALENLGARLVRWAKANDGRNVTAESAEEWSQELNAARESVAAWEPKK